MELDPFVLARIQFAANISFHILFPSISIGLAWILFYFRYRYHISGDKAWDYAYLFWVKIFALTFALGVVTGITMSFQFGTNWPGFSEITGNISGPLLGYEVLSAFFMEASFLGIMLFGRKRVTARMHVTATGLVAVGTSLSAFWILSLNSWMQTPAGYEIIDGKFFAVDWFEIIFNPSFPYRLAHVVTASVDHVSFQKPILMGDVITLEASVTRAFNTSVEIYVEVFAANIKGHDSRMCNHAYFTFVALDDEKKKPIKVAQLNPLTREEQKLYDSAFRRRELRLVLSGRIKPSEAKELKLLFKES